MKTLKFVTKYLFLFSATLILSGIVALALFIQSGIPAEFARQIAEKEMTKIFGWNVSIGKLSGSFFFGLELEDVTFKGHRLFGDVSFLTVESLSVHYNPLSILFHQGDFARATSMIKMTDMTFTILRNKNDNWTLFHIFAPQPNNAPPPPPTFRGIILFKNAEVSFIDEKGWGQAPLQTPFTSDFSVRLGKMNFSQIKKVQLHFLGTLKSNNQPVNFRGHFDPVAQSFRYKFYARPPIDTWGAYVFPFEGFELRDESPIISGYMTSKPVKVHGEIPFYYNINAYFTRGKFKTPFFESRLENLTAKVSLHHGVFFKDDFKRLGLSTQDSSALFSELVKAKILTKGGGLTPTFLASPKRHTKLSKMPGFGPDIARLINNPPVHFFIQRFDGIISQIPVSGKGYIGLADGEMALNVDTGKFNLNRIKTLFKPLERWQISGTGKSQVVMSGQTFSPTITGTLWADKGKLYGIQTDQVTLDYHMHNGRLNLLFRDGRLYDGTLSGSGHLQVDDPQAPLSFTFSGDHLDITRLFNTRSGGLSGTFNIQAKAAGPLQDYGVGATLNATSVLFFNQAIRSAATQFRVQNNANIVVSSAQIGVNTPQPTAFLNGRIDNLVDAFLNVSGTGIPFNDIKGQRSARPSGNLAVTGNIFAKITPQFWQFPPAATQANLTLTLDNYTLSGQPFDRLESTFMYDKTNGSISRFFGTYQGGTIHLSGDFIDHRPYALKIETQNLFFPKDALHQRFIPDFLKPIEGKVNMNLAVRRVVERLATSNSLLNEFNVTGSIQLSDAIVRGQPLKLGAFSGHWNGDQLAITRGELRHNKSKLFLDGIINGNKTWDFNLKEGSFVDLFDFQLLTFTVGRLLGRIGLNGHVFGSLQRPQFDLALDGKNIQTRHIDIDHIKGNIFFKNSVLRAKSVQIKDVDGVYKLSGHVDLKPMFSPDKVSVFDLDYGLDLRIENAKLAQFSNLIENLMTEIRSQFGKEDQSENAQDSLGSGLVGPPLYGVIDPNFLDPEVSLYRQNSEKTSYVFYNRRQEEQSALVPPDKIGFNKFFQGDLTGYLNVQSRKGQFPKILTDLQLANGQLSFLRANLFNFKTKTEGEKVNYWITISNGSMGNSPFEKFSSAGYLDEASTLWITKTSVKTDTSQNDRILSGVFPLSAIWQPNNRRELDLDIILEGDEISVISLFNPFIWSITNKGSVDLNISGTVDRPIINTGVATLKEAKIQLVDTIFKSPLQIKALDFSIVNNRITIPKTRITWKGEDTRLYFSGTPQTNRIDLEGVIDIQGQTFRSPESVIFDLDLTIGNADLAVKIENVYHGELAIRGTSLKGPFIIPISKEDRRAANDRRDANKEVGPVLTSEVFLKNGRITLPRLGEKPLRMPLKLDVVAHLVEDIFVGGSLLGQGAFAQLANNFDLTLAPSREPLLVTGTLNYPLFKSRLFFEEGSVNLFGRGFDLLNEKDQAIYFRDEQFRVRANSLAFSSQVIFSSGIPRLVPNVDISAVTIIDPLSDTSTQNIGQQKTYKALVVTLIGPIYELETIRFDEYDLPGTPIPNDSLVYVNTYNLSGRTLLGEPENEAETAAVLNLLTPGAATDPNQQRSSAEILSTFGEYQINSLVRRGLLRPLEKQIAKNVGLYDFRVDYNIGGAILGSAGVSEREDTPVGLHIVKDLLSDQLFLRVRTDLWTTGQRPGNRDTFSVSEIELTYYILSNLSVNYANILEDSERTYKPRASLRYGFEY